MAKTILKHNATQTTGAIVHSLVVPISETYRIIAATVKIAGTPTTSENYTITINANAGETFDTEIHSLDLQGATNPTDNIWFPDGYPLYLEGGDALDIAFPNTEAFTWASQITVERV